MSWEKVKGIVGQVAPILGNAIVPGVGGLAGSLVAKVLGADNTPGAVEAALASATPEQIAALKEAENRHEERLIELAAESDRAYLADRQDARQREIEVRKSGGSNTPMYLLAGLIVVGFFLLIGVLIFRSTAIPEGSREIAFILLGTLSSSFAGVVQYFFGSSKGSADKTKFMASRAR